MRIDLVKRIAANEFMGKTLSRDDLTFAVPPMVGDTVFWNADYGGEAVIYRYVGVDWIEVGLTAAGAHEVDTYVAAGWTLR